MIGEKIKIGFDGSEVKRGLAGIMGGFGKLGRGIGRATRQVGIGAARKMGSDLFGFILSGLKAIPNELEGLARLSKELDVMALSTGITEKKFLALRDAISKATGRDADEASDFLRDVSERLGEGMAEFNSAPRQAMVEMGIRVGDLKGQGIDEQMRVISEAFKSYQDTKGMNAAMAQINKLLGEVGKQMIPLFLDYEKGMDAAEKRTAGLSAQLKATKSDLESVFDIRQSIMRKFSELSLGVLKVFSEKTKGGIGTLTDSIDNLDISGFTNRIVDELKSIEEKGPFEWIKDKISEIGKWISEVIAKGIEDGIMSSIKKLESSAFKSVLDKFIPGVNFGKFFMPKGGKDSNKGGINIEKGNEFLKNWIDDIKSKNPFTTGKLEQNTGRTNEILERIADGGIKGVYA